jgi:hypothetical protein
MEIIIGILAGGLIYNTIAIQVLKSKIKDERTLIVVREGEEVKIQDSKGKTILEL